jgi:hypothetical protein
VASCQAYAVPTEIPAMLLEFETMTVRYYFEDDRIKYKTGQVVETPRLADKTVKWMKLDGVVYLHIRSAQNNCYQCRVERDQYFC